jgi:parallel beta-helix repeat (two copies)
MANPNKHLITIALVTLLITSISLVGASQAPIGAIIVPDDYSTIQTAIDHAVAGQEIYVKNGIYTQQHITIDKPVSLIGEDPKSTILIGINNIKYSPPYVIQISADGVVVSGFTITSGSLGGIRVETIGSDTQPSGVVIADNTIINNTNGISTYGGNNLTVSDNVLSNNGQFGIYMATSNSIITQNIISSNGLDGIIIDSCSEVTVSLNEIIGNGIAVNLDQASQGGINLRWTGDYDIFANNISNNKGYGVQFGENCNNAKIRSNNIAGNDVGVKLFNFPITTGSDSGIGTGNKVYQNNLENDQNAIIQTVFPYGNPLDLYETIGNGTDIVSWDNGAVGNYWSDYNGNGKYIIDQNNIDHYPLSQRVDISTMEPTSTLNLLDITLILSIGFAIIIAVVLLFFRRHRKKVG